MAPSLKSPKPPDDWVATLVDLLDGLLRRVLGLPYSVYGVPRAWLQVGGARDQTFWRAVADTTGLHLTVDAQGDVRLSGAGDGAKLLCAPDRAPRGGVSMRVSATGRPSVLRVVPAQDAPAGAWRTGDTPFDQVCACYGDPVALAAALTADARASLRALVAQGGELERGCASLTLPAPITHPHDAAEALRLVQEVVTRTQIPLDEQAEGLRAIVASDPSPAVQARALHALATGFPSTPPVATALADAASGTQPHLKLVARLRLGDVDGAAAVMRERPIRSLVDLALDTAEREPLSRLLIEAAHATDLKVLEAVAAGARRLPVGARLTVLTTLGRSTRGAAPTDRAIELTGALLASTFPPASDPPLAHPDLDAALLAFLDHPVEVLALAAVRTLGDHGTQESLPAMREAMRRVSAQVSRRLTSAIAEIQERFGAEHAGRVSLAEPDARGRVSVAQPPDDRDADR